MPTTFVVAAAWRGTGIGNSIYHAALWLTLTRQLDAHVKFAQCLPAGTYHLNTSSETRRRRRGELPPELRAMPNCSAPGTFELWEHLSRAGESLRATAVDFARASALAARHHPTCEELRELAALPSEPTVLLYAADAGMSQRCLQTVLAIANTPPNNLNQTFFDQRSLVPELRTLDLLPPRQLPPCRVGLHLRTMAVDRRGCNTFLDAEADAKANCVEYFRSHKPCALDRLKAAKGVCANGPRYVTSDNPAMYTMLPEWSNAGDRAVATWHTDNPAASFAADAKDTVAAWLTLASCTEAIIAPVASSFSSLAQLRAGTRVRYTHCCGAH